MGIMPPMKKTLLAASIVGLGLVAWPALAHTLDMTYLDIGTASSTLTLTVAINPHQAFELVSGGQNAKFNLNALIQHADLITAYTEDHVSVSRDGADCIWTPEPAPTAPTELEAEAACGTRVGARRWPVPG